ncbi:hypothetical protein WG219_18675 [Ectopseudomonas mendocina]|uniref:Uncharacterized protein n=1 Tax=Ectopseudomonas mendocina TaxID=300 RepID=A0ABZ2RE56_ECTME
MKTLATEQICRSLLQKAVRRGAVEVAEKAVVYLLQQGGAVWLRNRLGVIACEEVLAYVVQLEFTTQEDALIRQYTEMARAAKNKNAAGLGSLAAELENGYRSLLVKGDPTSKDLRIVAEAIRRPDAFWQWIHSQPVAGSNLSVIEKAETAFRGSGLPGDKVFSLASAYLAVINQIPALSMPEYVAEAFPYWIAIDKHTEPGKQALQQCAEALHVEYRTLGTIQYYLEGGLCRNLEPSRWWERDVRWQLERLGLLDGRAEVIWQDASAYLQTHLSAQVEAFKDELERVFEQYSSTLKTQDSLFG